MKNINVGIIGFGTIGSGVARALIERRAYLRRRLGATINLIKVCDINLRRKRPVQLNKGLLTRNANDIIDNPDINIVVELVGGISPAREFIVQAIKNKKDRKSVV